MWATADQTREQIVALHHASAREADATIAALELESPGRVPWWSADKADVTLGRILVHMIAETAHHAGHADIVREMLIGTATDRPEPAGVDGEQWAAYRSRLEQIAAAAGPDRLDAGLQPRPDDRSSRASAPAARAARACGSRGSSRRSPTASAAAADAASGVQSPRSSPATNRHGTRCRQPGGDVGTVDDEGPQGQGQAAPARRGDAVEDRRADGGIGGRGVGQQGRRIATAPVRSDRQSAAAVRAGGSGGAAPAAPARSVR